MRPLSSAQGKLATSGCGAAGTVTTTVRDAIRFRRAAHRRIGSGRRRPIPPRGAY